MGYSASLYRGEQMPAYVIADIDVHNPETYREYTALVPGTLERTFRDGRCQ
jgi:hypothetical protein